ncbi:MAG: hypothetical protein N2053_06410 [Chitinispirillaceae bacterium]|nr:hypothetical protein [Chitinispirillaceae bacterium]
MGDILTQEQIDALLNSQGLQDTSANKEETILRKWKVFSHYF